MNRFCDRLKLVLERSGLSQTELAQRCDWPPDMVNHFVHGRREPGRANLAILIDALPDVDARWLITGDNRRGQR